MPPGLSTSAASAAGSSVNGDFTVTGGGKQATWLPWAIGAALVVGIVAIVVIIAKK